MKPLKLERQAGLDLDKPRRRIASEERAQNAGRCVDRPDDGSELSSIGDVVHWADQSLDG